MKDLHNSGTINSALMISPFVYNYECIQYETNKMRFVWNINKLYAQKKIKQFAQFHSDVYYDMFQTICEDGFDFLIQCCGLPKYANKIAVKFEMFINKSCKISILSKIITFSYKNAILYDILMADDIDKKKN